MNKITKWISENRKGIAVGGFFAGILGFAIGQGQKQKAVSEALKKGCNMTALEYEKKLREQSKRFLSEKKVLEDNQEEYKQLLLAYEEEIIRLQEEVKKTRDEKKALRLLLKQKDKLQKVKKVG